MGVIATTNINTSKFIAPAAAIMLIFSQEIIFSQQIIIALQKTKIYFVDFV